VDLPPLWSATPCFALFCFVSLDSPWRGCNGLTVEGRMLINGPEPMDGGEGLWWRAARSAAQRRGHGGWQHVWTRRRAAWARTPVLLRSRPCGSTSACRLPWPHYKPHNHLVNTVCIRSVTFSSNAKETFSLALLVCAVPHSLMHHRCLRFCQHHHSLFVIFMKTKLLIITVIFLIPSLFHLSSGIIS